MNLNKVEETSPNMNNNDNLNNIQDVNSIPQTPEERHRIEREKRQGALNIPSTPFAPDLGQEEQSNTRYAQYSEQPSLPGGYQQDPYLQGYDDWEQPPVEQDISEQGLPSLNNVPNNRRLS